MSETVPIGPRDTAGTLSETLSHIGADLLIRALPALARGGIVPQPQSEDGVTYAHKITPDEARIDWHRPAAALDCHIRGLDPVPGAWTVLERPDAEPVRLKIIAAQPLGADSDDAPPGTIVGASGEGIDVACGERSVLRIRSLQRPGKAAQDADPFLRGFPLPVSTQLG